MKPKFVKPKSTPAPLLRCPVCGYEYRPSMPGWAFLTTKNTKCQGLDVPQERGDIRTMHSMNHPFEVVPE